MLKAVQSLIIPFVRSADQGAPEKSADKEGTARTTLVEYHKPEELAALMNFDLPGTGKGKEGLLATVEQVLKYSVNTWDQGFMDKLYATTNAVCFQETEVQLLLIHLRLELFPNFCWLS